MKIHTYYIRIVSFLYHISYKSTECNLVLKSLNNRNRLLDVSRIWPEGAPPFSRTVNILFLTSCLMFFVFTLQKANPNAKQDVEF